MIISLTHRASKGGLLLQCLIRTSAGLSDKRPVTWPEWSLSAVGPIARKNSLPSVSREDAYAPESLNPPYHVPQLAVTAQVIRLLLHVLQIGTVTNNLHFAHPSKVARVFLARDSSRETTHFWPAEEGGTLGTSNAIRPVETRLGGTTKGAASSRWQQELRALRAEVLGCQIDRLDLGQTLTVCDEVIQSRGFAQHMAINAAKLVAMRDDEKLRESVEGCDLVTADGQAVVWASRLLRDPVPERVAGIDLMTSLLDRAPELGYRIYILGARPEVLEAAVVRIREQHRGISIVGYRDGYYEAADEGAVVASIAKARPDILFVAMSSPRKEYFLARYGKTMSVPFVMGVGGAIDVAAGITRRAPVTMQRWGLEWLFRLAQEPRRLARRYFVTNTRFLLVLSREVYKRRGSGALHPWGSNPDPL